MKTHMLFAAGLAALVVGCLAASTEDDSMYLTGTEEQAVTNANGVPECTNPKKVLVCHVPPGNPENAHEICVGASAVKAHHEHHGDLEGLCEPAPPPCENDCPPPPPPCEGECPDGGPVE